MLACLEEYLNCDEEQDYFSALVKRETSLESLSSSHEVDQ